MNRFKFRLSLIDLLRGMAVQETAAAGHRLAASWAQDFYLPGFAPERRNAESYGAELAAFKRCFSPSELRALEELNSVIDPRAEGSPTDFRNVAAAAARALEAFHFPRSAPDRARNPGSRPAWMLSRVGAPLPGWRDHSASI